MQNKVELNRSQVDNSLPFEVPEGMDPVMAFKDMLSARRDGTPRMGAGEISWFGDGQIFTKERWVYLNLTTHTLEDLKAGRATGCYEVDSYDGKKGGSSQTIVLLLGGEEIYRVERFRPDARQKNT